MRAFGGGRFSCRWLLNLFMLAVNLTRLLDNGRVNVQIPDEVCLAFHSECHQTRARDFLFVFSECSRRAQNFKMCCHGAKYKF